MRDEIKVILDQYTATYIQAKALQDEQEISDYPSLLNASLVYHLADILDKLSTLLNGTDNDNDIKTKFEAILKKHWEDTKETSDVFNHPNDAHNRCLKDIARIVYPELNDTQILLELVPGIKQCMVLELRKNHPDRFLLTAVPISEVALSDSSSEEWVVSGDTLLPVSAIAPCLGSFERTKKMLAHLKSTHPTLHDTLIAQNENIAHLFSIITQQQQTPREALTALTLALKFSGSSVTGKVEATEAAEKAIFVFQRYLGYLQPELQEQVNALISSGRTLKWIIETYLVTDRECVESTSDMLQSILDHASCTSILDTKPLQLLSEEEIKKIFQIEVNRIFINKDGAYNRTAINHRISEKIIDVLLKNINIKKIDALLTLLSGLDADYFLKIAPEKMTALLPHYSDFLNVFAQINPQKQTAFLNVIKDKLILPNRRGIIWTWGGFSILLNHFNDTQCALLLNALKNTLAKTGGDPGIIGDTYDFCHMLKSLNNAQHTKVLTAVKNTLIFSDDTSIITTRRDVYNLFYHKNTFPCLVALVTSRQQLDKLVTFLERLKIIGRTISNDEIKALYECYKRVRTDIPAESLSVRGLLLFGYSKTEKLHAVENAIQGSVDDADEKALKQGLLGRMTSLSPSPTFVKVQNPS